MSSVEENGGRGHVQVPYPTAGQAAHAVMELVAHATGSDEMPTPELVNGAWVALGGGLSLAFPVGGEEGGGFGGGKSPKITAPQRKALERAEADLECVAEDGAGGDEGRKAIDPEKWRKLAKVVLEILLKYVSCVAVLALLGGTSAAQQFTITKADPPAPAFTVTVDKPADAEAARKVEEMTRELNRLGHGADKLGHDREMEAARQRSESFRVRSGPSLRERADTPLPPRTGGDDECPDGCCHEKGGPTLKTARQGDTLLASLNGGRGELSWRDAARLSIQSRKPVLEWVGDELCPRCVDDTSGEFVHFFTKNAAGKSVNVWLPGSDGEHYKIGTLTKWVEGSPKWGHAASARKVVKAWNTGRPTTLDGWAAPEVDPSMGPPPDSPMWGRTGSTVQMAMHDPAMVHNPAATFRDPAFIVTPSVAPQPAPVIVQPQTFAPPMMFQSAPVMMSAPAVRSAPRMGLFRGRRSGGGCAGGSCG